MGWWNNMRTTWRKRSSSPATDPEEYIDVSTPSSDTASEPPPPAPAKKGSWLTRWSPGARRDRQIAWLQAGYSEMLTLMRGINEHLTRQEDVQHKMVDVLDKLPQSMDGLKSVGKAAEQQVEVLVLLREQLSSSVQHDQQLVDSMNKFNHTLGVMDETSRTSGRTVSQLIERARDSDTLLREVVERSERRFMLLTLLFLLAVILGVGAAIYATTYKPRAGAPEAGAVDAPHAMVTTENRPPAAVVKPQDELEDASLAGIPQVPASAVEAEAPAPPAVKPARSLWGKLFGPRAQPAPETPTGETAPATEENIAP